MPTKNAHQPHENASGQNATLPNFSFCSFPRPPLWNAQSDEIPTISDKFPTSQSSQNISKTQCFHTQQKRETSSVSWIVHLFETANNNNFPIKNTIFTSFKKGQHIMRMHNFHKKKATTTNHVTTTAPALQTTPTTTAHDHC